jgi:hypothetical protein
MKSKAEASAQQRRNTPGDSFCSQFSSSSPTATIFLEPDTDSDFMSFVTQPDDAGPESIGKPIDF